MPSEIISRIISRNWVEMELFSSAIVMLASIELHDIAIILFQNFEFILCN